MKAKEIKKLTKDQLIKIITTMYEINTNDVGFKDWAQTF